MTVVADSGGVGGTITLSTWLDPDEGVDEGITGVGGWAGSEAGAADVAPVSPLNTATWLDTGAGGIDDEVGWETLGGQERGEGVDVALLVAVGVGAGEGGALGDGEAVVVGDVGGESTDSLWLASLGVELCEHVGGRADVGGPSEPSSVASIKVHGHVGKVQLLHGVDGEGLVGGCGVGALRDTHVGDHVSKGIWLDDEDDLDIAVLHYVTADGINVVLVLGNTTVGDGPLAVGGKSGAVTVWEIVDNKVGNDLLGGAGSVYGRNIAEVGVKRWDLGHGVTAFSVSNMFPPDSAMVLLTARRRFRLLRPCWRQPWQHQSFVGWLRCESRKNSKGWRRSSCPGRGCQ